MSEVTKDAALIRAVLKADGAAQGSAVLQALARLEMAAALYAFVRPILADENGAAGGDRMRRVGAELLRGHRGEGALRRAAGL
jgi:hypothetical protein